MFNSPRTGENKDDGLKDSSLKGASLNGAEQELKIDVSQLDKIIEIAQSKGQGSFGTLHFVHQGTHSYTSITLSQLKPEDRSRSDICYKLEGHQGHGWKSWQINKDGTIEVINAVENGWFGKNYMSDLNPLKLIELLKNEYHA